jgi:hypothetical protein
MKGDPKKISPHVNSVGWTFSSIDGDPDLGRGVKCYATRQFNSKLEVNEVIFLLNHTADILIEYGCEVLRKKIELVIYDERL